jgi:hypothetical protein
MRGRQSRRGRQASLLLPSALLTRGIDVTTADGAVADLCKCAGGVQWGHLPLCAATCSAEFQQGQHLLSTISFSGSVERCALPLALPAKRLLWSEEIYPIQFNSILISVPICVFNVNFERAFSTSHSAIRALTAMSVPPPLRPEECLPLQFLLSNWARRTRDGLAEMLDSGSGSGSHPMHSHALATEELARRQKLFLWMTSKQRQLGQMFALAHFTLQNDAQLQRIKELQTKLQQRENTSYHVTASLQAFHRRIEELL